MEFHEPVSRALDIDDEAVLLKVRDRAKALDGMHREGKSKYEYDDYLSELSQMEQVIKGYFKDRGNDALLNLKLEEAGIRQSFKQFAMTEGTIAWIDGWVITKPTSGASLDLAHKYIDTMIGAQVQTKLAELVGFGVVNPAGSGGFSPVIKDSTWWYQDIKTFPSRLEIMIPEEDANRRVELWNKVKAMP